jgi:hypothetical protein
MDAAILDYLKGLARWWWVLAVGGVAAAVSAFDFFIENLDIPVGCAWTALGVAFVVANYLAYRDLWLKVRGAATVMLQRLSREAAGLVPLIQVQEKWHEDFLNTEFANMTPEQVRGQVREEEARVTDLMRKHNIRPWVEKVNELPTKREWEVFDSATSTEPFPSDLEEISELHLLRRYVQKRVDRLDDIIASRGAPR